jgi:hypothetical protein
LWRTAQTSIPPKIAKLVKTRRLLKFATNQGQACWTDWLSRNVRTSFCRLSSCPATASRRYLQRLSRWGPYGALRNNSHPPVGLTTAGSLRFPAVMRACGFRDSDCGDFVFWSMRLVRLWDALLLWKWSTESVVMRLDSLIG